MQESERGKFEAEWKRAFENAELTPSESVWQGIGLRSGQGGDVPSSFENGWKSALGGAELIPSEEVWKAIDVSLVQAENASMRGRVAFYQRMAAASIIVLMLVSGYFLFLQDDTTSNLQAVENGIGQGSNPSNSSTSDKTPVETKATDSKELLVDNAKELLNKGTQPGNSYNTGKYQTAPSTGISPTGSMGENLVANQLPDQRGKKGSDAGRAFVFQNSPISAVSLVSTDKLPNAFGPNDYSIAYRLADLIPARSSKRKPIGVLEKQWASVGFAAGSYNSGVGGSELVHASSPQTQTAFAALQSDQSTTQEEKVKTGTSMSFAISAGKRIFKRWVLQGGISYLNQSLNSTANTVTVAPANQVLDAKFNADYAPEATNSVTYTTSNEINSNYQFISIPLQAGYMLVDRKFGLQINGGVAPDFFLKSSVYDNSTQVETINSATGNNETFKAVSLAGLGGVEISYRLSKNYRISLAPGFRYSFTQVFKENSLASAKPFVADIGLRFKYVFN